tara:strand:- start:226 stop:420 length:195 start_codon:yes stop_codon:yes gene_type:complete
MRTDEEIRIMLTEAESIMDAWLEHFEGKKMNVRENAEAIRNYTALRGVVKALNWVLGSGENPLN